MHPTIPSPARRTARRFSQVWTLAGAALFGLAAMAAAPAAHADDFPNKPLRFIVPYVPGGPTDLIARAIAEPLAARLKQPVVVENKPGASGAIGTNLVAHAPADGHTLLLSNIGDTVTVALGVKVPYDYVRDLQPISMLGRTPFVLVVGSKLPVTTVKDLIQYVKQNPDAANFGSSGTGSASQLAAELFLSSIGIHATHVPYKGQAEASVALMGNQLLFMFANPVNTLTQIEGGALRALAVSSGKRYAPLPDVPTAAESGVPGYDVSTWFGLMTTGGTPVSAVERLNKEVRDILAQPEVREKLARLGVEAKSDTPQEFAQYIDGEIARWTKAVRDAGIRAQQ